MFFCLFKVQACCVTCRIIHTYCSPSCKSTADSGAKKPFLKHAVAPIPVQSRPFFNTLLSLLAWWLLQPASFCRREVVNDFAGNIISSRDLSHRHNSWQLPNDVC